MQYAIQKNCSFPLSTVGFIVSDKTCFKKGKRGYLIKGANSYNQRQRSCPTSLKRAILSTIFFTYFLILFKRRKFTHSRINVVCSKRRLEGLKYNIDFGGRGGRNQEEGISTLLSPILALNSCMFLHFFT